MNGSASAEAVRSALHGMNTFHKLDTLIEALQAFRTGWRKSARLYKRRERE